MPPIAGVCQGGVTHNFSTTRETRKLLRKLLLLEDFLHLHDQLSTIPKRVRRQQKGALAVSQQSQDSSYSSAPDRSIPVVAARRQLGKESTMSGSIEFTPSKSMDFGSFCSAYLGASRLSGELTVTVGEMKATLRIKAGHLLLAEDTDRARGIAMHFFASAVAGATHVRFEEASSDEMMGPGIPLSSMALDAARFMDEALKDA